jgi:putative ABC transport system substrate-binding protein
MTPPTGSGWLVAALTQAVLAAPGWRAAPAAREPTRTIPIVSMALADPMGGRLVASRARPGGNATGTTVIAPELGGRRPQLLNAFARMPRQRPHALLTILDPVRASYRRLIAEFALKNRLPATLAVPEFTHDGGLSRDDPNLPELFKRELVVNLRTARALGLAIPPSVLIQADEVIQ